MAGLLDGHRELILELSKEKLRKRLHPTRSGLLDLLLQNQVLTHTEAEEIRSAHTKAEQVDVLLDCLQEKTNQQFDEFCGALHVLQKSHIYQELLSDDVIHRHVEAIQQKLCRYFTEEYSMVDMFAMHDEGHRVRMEEIYVPITTVIYQSTPEKPEKKYLDHYTEIFSLKCSLIIVKAEPLGGKTTFVRKVCNDWAQVILGQAEWQCFTNFKVALPIILRLVQQGSDLSQVLQHQLHFLTQKDLKVIFWLMEEEPERVLFLMDGLDEFPVSNSPEVFGIIRDPLHKQQRDYLVIITTRAEGMSQLQSCRPKVEAELEGFSWDHIEKYVSMYFAKNRTDDANSTNYSHQGNAGCGSMEPGDRENIRQSETPAGCEELLFLIYKTRELLDMAINPGRLGILCLIWSHNKHISKDRVQLFSDFLCILLKLAERKLNITPERCKEQLISCYKDLLLRFGKLAYKEKGNIMCTVFNMQEVEATVGKEAMKYGFLYRSHPVSHMQDSQVSFIHKTIQDWLAAFYIAHNENELHALHYASAEELNQHTSLHGFLLHFCEANEKSSYLLCKSLLPHFKGMFAWTLMNVNWPGSWLQQNIKGFIKVLLTIHDMKESNVVPKISQMDLHNNWYMLCAICFGLVLGCLKELKEVILARIIHKKDEWEAFVNAVGNVELATEWLQFQEGRSTNRHLAGGGPALAELLLKMPHCSKLYAEGCGFTCMDLHAMVPSMMKLLHLKYIDFSGSNFTGGGRPAGELLHCFSSDPKPSSNPLLHRLKMSRCGLTAKDLQAMVAVIKGRQLHIKELDFSQNDLGGGGQAAGELLTCFSSSPIHKLELYTYTDTLDMSECQMTMSDMQDMVAVLRGTQVNMKQLTWSWRSSTREDQTAGEVFMGLSSTSSSKQHGHHLEALSKSGCSLTVTVANAEKLEFPATDHLNKTRWKFTGRGQFCGELLQCFSASPEKEQPGNLLERFNIIGCDLTPHDLKTMVIVIKDRPAHIRELYFSHNNFAGGGQAAGELVLSLSASSSHMAQGGSHVDTLRLRHCDLTAGDLQAMVSVIKQRKACIRLLDLGENNFAGGGRAVGELLLCFPPSYSHEKQGFGVGLLKCGLTVSDLQAMCDAILGHQLHIQELYLVENNFEGGGELVANLLLCLSPSSVHDKGVCNVQILDMSDCKLTTSDLQTMVNNLKGKQVNIRQLHLSENNFSGGGQAVGELLLCLSSSCSSHQTPSFHVDTLGLSACKLTVSDLQAMVAVTKAELLHMQQLDLSRNNFAGGAVLIVELLLCLFSSSSKEQQGYIDTLNMTDCFLTITDLQVIVDVIKENQLHISKFHLSHNTFTGGGQAVGELLLHLSSSSNQEQNGYATERVDLPGCELDERDLQAMLAVIKGTKLCIKQLDLSQNRFKGCGHAVGELLLHLTRCEYLDLQWCGLTKSDLIEAANAASGADIHIDKLFLVGNEHIQHENRAHLQQLLPFITFEYHPQFTL